MKKILFIFFGFCFIVLFLGTLYFEGMQGDRIQEKKDERNAQLIAQKIEQEETSSLQNEQFDFYENPFIPVAEEESFNNELQKYITGYANVENRSVQFVSDKIDDLYMSGKVVSKCAFRYGRFSFFIPKTLTDKGLFPAIWMLPQNNMKFPEVDIYEMIGSDPYKVYCTMHYDQDGVEVQGGFQHYISQQQVENGYTLTFEWTPERMDWYIDGTFIGSVTEHVPDMYMYMICNLAIGGDWPGNPDDSIFPKTFEVEILEFSPQEIIER